MPEEKESTAIARRQEAGELAPTEAEDIIQHASKWATALSRIVEERQLFKLISGRKHLLAEAWQTIVALDQAYPDVVFCDPIKEGTEIVGYVAKVNIMKQGEVVASGIMPCGLEEFPCRGKTGFAAHRAAMSSAQTWAGEKAARSKYAWVVTLSGYAATPADEMPQEHGDEPPGPPADPSMFCQEHKTIWFKKGRMKQYAHPLDSGEWCNKPVEKPTKPTSTSTHPSPPAQPPKASKPSPGATEGVSGETPGPPETLTEHLKKPHLYDSVLEKAGEYGLDEEALLDTVIRLKSWKAFEDLGGTPDIAAKRLKDWIVRRGP